jgi:glucokinase-like ROK family protein
MIRRRFDNGLKDQLDTLVTVLDLVRSGAAQTRPELGRRSGLGRTVVTQRVADLLERGLLEEDGEVGPSTGGRAPRVLRFRAKAGSVLVGEFGATSLAVGLADLAGNLIERREEPLDVAIGADKALERLEGLLDPLVDAAARLGAPVWGLGVGLPGPVEFASGRPVAPPIMPDWDGYPVRERLSARFDVPVWVDNEVNLMALGESRAGGASGQLDIVYLKIGTGIGAGLVMGGRLHRGAQGCAGDVGHIAIVDDTTIVCRCGNVGCLEALAGGAAIARQGALAAAEGRSPFLAELAAAGGPIDAVAVAQAAAHLDPASVELLRRAGRLIGETLATVVNLYNPALVLIGGGVANVGEPLLGAIRETVYRRSLALATRELRVLRSPLGDDAGLTGGALMVIDELCSRERIGRWIDHGSPVGRPDLV